MKSGGFDEVSTFYKINKLHKHSHLYTSEELIDFPGRIFEIVKYISIQQNRDENTFRKQTSQYNHSKFS